MKSVFTRNRISGSLCLAIGIIVYLLSTQFPSLDDGYPGPGLFPSILGIVLGLSGLFILIRSETSDTDKPQMKERQTWRFAALVALMMLAYLVVPVTGLLPVVAGVVFLTALLASVDGRWALVASVVTTAFIYLVFTLLLGVPI